MGNFFSNNDHETYQEAYDDDALQFYNEGRGMTSLKLEAQKIRDFSGLTIDWTKWKNRTECAFDGSGYGKILTDSNYAKGHPMMNRIVYAQLSVATSDGTSHHLVKQFDQDRDGHEAWQALCEWYDGDLIKNENAEIVRVKLDGLKLYPGISASDYINNFMNLSNELNKIDGEAYSENHYKFLFLKNI